MEILHEILHVLLHSIKELAVTLPLLFLTYLGMEALGISCITNMATGIAVTKHSHEEVVRIANESSARLCKWVEQLIKAWD
jgi:hypothetical protein